MKPSFSLKGLFVGIAIAAVLVTGVTNANMAWSAALDTSVQVWLTCCLVGCFLSERFRPFFLGVVGMCIVQSAMGHGHLWGLQSGSSLDTYINKLTFRGEWHWQRVVTFTLKRVLLWSIVGVFTQWLFTRRRGQ